MRDPGKIGYMCDGDCLQIGAARKFHLAIVMTPQVGGVECRVAALPAVVGKGLSMCGHRALHSSVVPISLVGHALGVDVACRERETAHSNGVDSVLVLLARSSLDCLM